MTRSDVSCHNIYMGMPPPAKAKRKGFSDQVKLFIEALVANPNVTRAYMRAYPLSTAASACASGHRLLRNALIKRAVEFGRKDRLDRYGLDADEAMKRIALIGRADIRELFDERGAMLPVTQWPEEIALAVKGVKRTAYGTAVSFDSRLAALKLIAAAGGKLSRPVEAKVTLVELLVAHAKPEDWVRRRPKTTAGRD